MMAAPQPRDSTDPSEIPQRRPAIPSSRHASGSGRESVLALLVPADERIPVSLLWLTASSATFSDAIGGGLLDDSLDAVVDQTVNGTADGAGYVVLLDEHRVPKGLPCNQRAAVLAARLGHLDRRWLADLRGDALVVGFRPTGTDTDVPAYVIDAAARSGLLGPAIRTATHRTTTCTWPWCSPSGTDSATAAVPPG